MTGHNRERSGTDPEGWRRQLDLICICFEESLPACLDYGEMRFTSGHCVTVLQPVLVFQDFQETKRGGMRQHKGEANLLTGKAGWRGA